jgi:hypothetical protein
MKQDEIIQTTIIYLMQKGINTDELLIRRLEILDKFNSIRSKILSDFIVKEYEISSRNYQTTFIDKSAYTDDGETNQYSYFNTYPTIMGRTAFVGSTDGKCRFREYLTISEYQSTIKSVVPKITGYYPESGKLKVDNPMVEVVRVNATFTNPYALETFNPDYDEYPVDDALIPQICEGMYQVYFAKIAPIQPDTINDNTQTPKA